MPAAPAADADWTARGSAVSRLAAVICSFAVLPATALGASPPRSWAQPQIKLVTAAGIFDGTPAAFDPSAPLTEGALAGAVTRLTSTPWAPAADPAAPVSLEALDSALVQAIGLSGAAALFNRTATTAGLNPPARFGTETVARLLGLRVDLPVRDEALELEPQQTATRADAAYSLARLLRLGGGTAAGTPDAIQGPFAGVGAAAAAFTLPALTPWQRQILSTAISYIGYPYVWGGTLDHAAGFDCSGFVWQVYRLTQYPDEGSLAGVLKGRTTMAMSAEVPKSERIGLDALEPGDVLFFGRGPQSKPKQIDHMGIYLGNGWLINSSSVGVALAPLSGWYADSFAWARRPLAEAGLS